MKQQGVTFLELLFTLAISIIVLTIAVPNYHRFITQQQLSHSSQQLLALLNYTRQLAVAQGGAYICDGELGCDDFQRPNAVAVYLKTPQGTLESHQWQPLPPHIDVQWRRFRGQHLYFNTQGRSVFSNGHFLLCHENSRHLAYKIVMNWSGRARIEKTTTDNC